MYHKALAQPVARLEVLYQEYETWENGINPVGHRSNPSPSPSKSPSLSTSPSPSPSPTLTSPSP